MLTVACLANRFPAAVEPYVREQIAELRGRGIRVICGSVAKTTAEEEGLANCDVVLRPARAAILLRALWLCVCRWDRIAGLVARVLFRGNEGPIHRLKALVHTVWGACYAVRLEPESVDHIYAQHGFSASWIAMTAARLLGADFSMTLYGSDLLLHRAYMDVKLENCAFCLTVSEYNRRFIMTHYPKVDQGKVMVARLGVEVPEMMMPASPAPRESSEPFRILAVGRLHAVKDHAFLVQACARLQDSDLNFYCEIAGKGPERSRLQSLIHENRLEGRVVLLGHPPPEEIDRLYRRADLVALTSRSEGIPLVLMEAMARAKLVLAPAITGIPELVIAGKTGFLYEPGSMDDFLEQLLSISSAFTGCRTSSTQTSSTQSELSHSGFSVQQLDWVRHAARVHVQQNFNRKQNLESFADLFLRRVAPQVEDRPDENFVLQQT